MMTSYYIKNNNIYFRTSRVKTIIERDLKILRKSNYFCGVLKVKN